MENSSAEEVSENARPMRSLKKSWNIYRARLVIEGRYTSTMKAGLKFLPARYEKNST
jgi:hypothetical protein